MKPRAPFVWSPDQPIDPMGFRAQMGGAPPRAEPPNRWMLFRRVITLELAPAQAIVRCTVDGRYQLFVNGVRVGRGPMRCSPLFQRFDTYDLAPQLFSGANVIAALVHVYGVDTAWYETVKGMWAPTFGDGAFWLEGDAGSVRLDSGPEWRCLESRAWAQDTARINHSLGFIEVLDARELAPDWLTPAFNDSAWKPARALYAGGGGPEAFFGGMETRPFPTLLPREIPQLVETFEPPVAVRWVKGLAPRPDLPVHRRCYREAFTDAPCAVDVAALIGGDTVEVYTAPGQDLAILLDFGRLLTGYPTVTLDAKGGEIIEIAVAEGLPGEWDDTGPAPEARITPQPLLGHDAHVARYIARPGRQTFERFEWSAVRWMQITVRNAEAGLAVARPGVTFTHYPVAQAGAFACSDALLSQLWKTGAYTLQLCMQDSWVDCPSREQRQWLGDATVENLVGHAAFGPSVAPLNAAFLRHAAQSQRPDGLTQMFAPGDHARDGILIPDWTLQWILNAGDHLAYTGDVAVIAEIFPAIERAIAWFEQRLSPAGLVADLPYWHFMDWASVGRTGEALTLNAQYAGALSVAADLAEAIDCAGPARRLRRRASEVCDALNARHWDEGRGVFVDGVDPRNGRQDRRVSQHGNAAMALWGKASSSRLARALRYVSDPQRLVFTPGPPITSHAVDFDEDHDVVLANTFYAHFVYSALAEHGLFARALELMSDKLGPMIRKGSSTLWESLEPTASLCHGFSASPTWQLTTRLLGVRPSAPGYARARFSPNLAGLKWANGVVPTQHGLIGVDLKMDSELMIAQVHAPAGVLIDVAAAPGWRVSAGPASFAGAARVTFVPECLLSEQ
jgi:hypothetical protein